MFGSIAGEVIGSLLSSLLISALFVAMALRLILGKQAWSIVASFIRHRRAEAKKD